jgi:hypothetical protein
MISGKRRNKIVPAVRSGAKAKVITAAAAGEVFATFNNLERLEWYHKVPVINYFHGVFFEGIPTPEQVTDMYTRAMPMFAKVLTCGTFCHRLNLFGLIAALMLGVLIAIPTAFTAAEMESTIQLAMKNSFELASKSGHCAPLSVTTGGSSGPCVVVTRVFDSFVW